MANKRQLKKNECKSLKTNKNTNLNVNYVAAEKEEGMLNYKGIYFDDDDS